MPQSHPTMGPVRFLGSIRFLALKAEWSARRNFTPVLFSWSHQAMGAVWFDMAVHLVWLNNSQDSTWTLRDARTGVVRALHGNLQCFLYPTGPLQCPLRPPHGLFMGCLWSQNPYRARKLIMHALKLYRPRTGRQNSYGAVWAPWVDVRFLFKTAWEQNIQPGPGSVMWLRHYILI